MAIIGSVETVRGQTPRTPAFAVAWTYIEQLLRPGSALNARIGALAAGDSQKHDLGAGVFAIEQAYQTKPRAEGFFESHRKYLDIQVVVAGRETMELADLSRAKVRQPYQEERDLITYEDVVDASLLRVVAGEAAVFYPPDVHMPSLRLGDAAVLVRKSVLKVPVQE